MKTEDIEENTRHYEMKLNGDCIEGFKSVMGGVDVFIMIHTGKRSRGYTPKIISVITKSQTLSINVDKRGNMRTNKPEKNTLAGLRRGKKK